MFNFITKKLSARKQNKLRQAKLRGYGFGWAHYQLEHWPLEALEEWITPATDDYGPEITAWDAGLREAIQDIEAFSNYRREILGYRKAGQQNATPTRNWSDFHGDLGPKQAREQELARRTSPAVDPGRLNHPADTRSTSSQAPLFADELPTTGPLGHSNGVPVREERPTTSYGGTHGHTATTSSCSSDSGSCDGGAY